MVNWGNRSSSPIDFKADFEIGGTPITTRRFTSSTSGDKTLITPSGGKRLKIYKAIITVSADITGEIILKLGNNELGGIKNPKSGGQYIFISNYPDFDLGDAGDTLVINLPGTDEVTLNTSYEEI